MPGRSAGGEVPLLATRADTGEVLHARLRIGSANSARAIVRFVDELLARVARAGGGDAIIVRADSGFYQHKLLNRLSKAGVGFSVTIHQRAPVRTAIDAIAETAWQHKGRFFARVVAQAKLRRYISSEHFSVDSGRHVVGGVGVA